MKYFYPYRAAAATVLLGLSLSAQAQTPTKISNFSYGSFSAARFYAHGNNLFFLGKFQADGWEFFKLNTTDNSITQLTNDHYRTSSGTIFRTLYRFGNNIFSGAAKPNSDQNIEFSRFDMSTETEQWEDLYPGFFNPSLNIHYSSDPIAFGQDPATGYVYTNALTASSGQQIFVWNPNTSNITQLTTINGSNGISQNSDAGLEFLGDTLYTAGTIGSTTGLLNINKNNGGYVFHNGSNGGFSAPKNITILNNKIYFTARNNQASPNDYINLYVYKPADGSITRLTNYTLTTGDGNLSGMNAGPDGTLYVNVSYFGTNPTQGDFFSVNTNTDVVTYRPGPSNIIRNVYLHATSTHVYVQRINGSARELHKIQLSDNSSIQLNTPSLTAIASSFPASNNKLYFSATNATYGSEVYELNLANDSVVRKTDINTSGNSIPAGFSELNGNLYFMATATTTADREIYSMPLSPATALPLNWLRFEARKQSEETAVLEWQTGEERNTRGFVPQFSTDGHNWKDAGWIAAGNGRYQTSIPAPGAGRCHFRIREVATDEKSSLSPTRTLDFNAAAATLKVNPNPAADGAFRLTLSRHTPAGDINIQDASGRIIQRLSWQGGEGHIDWKAPASGLYLIRLGGQSVKAVAE